MASNYPTSLDSFTDPLSNSPLNNPSHAGQHQDLNNSVEQLEVKVGIGASAATSATSGQVLTADGSGGSTWQNPAVTAAQFANVGLTFITSTTVPAGASSITIANCFSSTYDNYRFVFSGARCTTGAQFVLAQLRVSGTTSITGYYHARLEAHPVSSAQALNDPSWYWSVVVDSVNYAGGVVDVFNPNNAVETSFTSNGTDPRTAGAFLRSGAGWHDVTTAYTDIVLSLTTSSTWNAGTITVFGYKKG